MPRQLGSLLSPEIKIAEAPSLANSQTSPFGQQKAATAIIGNEEKVQQAMTGGRRLGTLSGDNLIPGFQPRSQPFFPPTEQKPFPPLVNEQDINEINKLIDSLSGQVPRTKEELPDIVQSPSISGFGVAAQATRSAEQTKQLEADVETRRSDSFKILTDPKGRFQFSPQQVQSLVAGKEAAKPPSQKFQTAAAVAASLAAGAVIPGPADDIAIASTLLRLAGQPAIVGSAAAAGAALDAFGDPERDINLRDLAKVFGKEALLELGFGAVGETGSALFGRGRRIPVDNIDDLNRFLSKAAGDPSIQKALKDEGLTRAGGKVFFSPGKASDLPSAQTVDAIVGASVLSSGQAARKANRVTRVARANVKRIPLQIGKVSKELDPRTVTNFGVDAIKNTEKAADDVARVMFDELDKLTGKARVNLKGVSKEATEEIKSFEDALGLGFEGPVKSTLNKLVKGQEVSFKSAQKIRSVLLRKQRDLQRSANPNSELLRVVNKFATLVDDAMEEAADGLGGQAKKLWRKGNGVWKENRELFGAQVVADIIKQRPNNSKMIFQILKEGDPEQVGLVLKSIKDPKVIEKVKSGFLSSMMRDATEVTSRKTAGRELVGDKLLDAWTKIPEGVRKQIYGDKADEIQKAFRVLALSEETAKSGGLVGIRAAQSLAVAGLIAVPIAAATGQETGFGGEEGALTATAGVLLIGPEVLASLVLRRPGFAKLLGQGLKFNRVNRKSTAALTRIGRLVLSEKKRLNTDRKKEIKKQVTEVRKAKFAEELSGQFRIR